jgi:hypothetical protein
VVNSGLGTGCQRVFQDHFRFSGEIDIQHGVVLDLGLSKGRTVSGDEDEFGYSSALRQTQTKANLHLPFRNCFKACLYPRVNWTISIRPPIPSILFVLHPFRAVVSSLLSFLSNPNRRQCDCPPLREHHPASKVSRLRLFPHPPIHSIFPLKRPKQDPPFRTCRPTADES